MDANPRDEVVEEVKKWPPTEVRVLQWMSISLKIQWGGISGTEFPYKLRLSTKRVSDSAIVFA